MKKGISLVALVITIIVLIILSGTVILTVVQNGMIDKSEEAVFKNNVKTFLEDYTNTKLEKQLKDKGGFNESTINASLADNNIKEWIPNITDEFIERIFISNGVFLADKTKYTEEEIVWLEELGIEFGIAPVLGTTELWQLDETKTIIKKYLGPLDNTGTITISIPNKVKDKETNQIYTIDIVGYNETLFLGSWYIDTLIIPNNIYYAQNFKNGTNEIRCKNLYIGDNVEFENEIYGKGCINIYIGDNVKFRENAFNYANDLTKLIIGDNFNCKGSILNGTSGNLEKLIKLTIGDNLTVNSRSFCYLHSIEEITIGNNAILITDSITNNENLKKVNIGNSLSVKEEYSNLLSSGILSHDNPKLVDVNIGSFKEVCENTLKNCTAIKKVVLEDGGVISGVSAFENCTGIEEVVIGNVDMSSLATTHNTFTGCSGIKKVTIGKGAGEKLKSSLFKAFTSIEDVVIEENAILSTSMFNICTGIKTVTFKNNVTLGASAFNGCSNLETLNIQGDLKATVDTTSGLGVNCFFNCKNLSTVNMEEGLTKIPRGMFVNCSGLTKITIPSTVKVIGLQAFYGAGLTTLEIPGNVEKINNNAFANCDSLTSVTIRKGVKIIGESIFAGSDNLESISIANTVTEIGNNAFVNLTKLEAITVGSEAVADLVTASGYKGTVVVDTSINN